MEGRAFWAVLVVMATVWWTVSSSTNRGPFPPKTLCTSYVLVTHDNPRWKKGPAVSVVQSRFFRVTWKQRKWRCVGFSREAEVSASHLCFQPRISEIENLRTHLVITIQRTYLAIKHMPIYAIVLGWFPLFFLHGQCCVSVDRETPNCLHISTPELRFLLHRWPRFK